MGKYYENIDTAKEHSDYMEKLIKCRQAVDEAYEQIEPDEEMLKRKYRLLEKTGPVNSLTAWANRLMGREAETAFRRYCAVYEMKKIDEKIERYVQKMKSEKKEKTVPENAAIETEPQEELSVSETAAPEGSGQEAF